MIDATQIKLQVLMFTAQKAGIEEQLRRLKEIPCPVCQGGSQPGHIEREDHETAGFSTRFEPCEACNGTGYACGERPGY